ncbi:malonic semialdehyde reductase [Porphyrobacter algicida]|uniref:Putative NADH dehydrogenase/NAD(P)H nitroreductase GRI58_08255 n=1 Tax=Qipengyuania algicida TaxID=1836209 RepID=A0A845AE88_9SPHN|nr:malonic semialdehyde reductase [Qipengyuania algicida]MXP28812.1 malonic semialdehyde reductase [Qipengyuania algicida]
MTKQFHDHALDSQSLDQLFREARTYNGWLKKDVSDEQLHAIWDLMKMGPTSANQQPVRIVWVKSDEAKAKLAECVSEGNHDKVLNAPVTALIAYDVDFHEELPWLFPHTDAKSWFEGNEELRHEHGFRNSSLQGAYLILAARALGLDTGPMSGFDAGSVEKAFFADNPRHKVNFICSIGYGDPESIFDRSPRPDFDRFSRIA